MKLIKKIQILKEQKCFFCEHSINQHDFNHNLECRTENCDCDEFVYETKKCELCDKIVDRKRLSELMLNPNMQLIPLCDEHFTYEQGEKMVNEVTLNVQKN